MTLYRAFPDGVWHNAVNNEEAEARDFFQKMFAGLEEPTVPFGLLARDASSLEKSVIDLDAGLVKRLREQAQGLEVGAEALCHLAWALVLARISGRDDVAFGTALAAFGKILPFRIKLSEAEIGALARMTQELLGEVRHHAQAPLTASFDTISPTPLYTAVMSYRRASDRAVSSITTEGSSAETIESYPLSLVVEDLGEEFQLTALAQMPVEARRVCDFMRAALEQLVDALETAPDTAAQTIDVMPPAERRQVLVEWNATEADYPKDKCVHELFEAQAARTPDAVAVVQGDRHLTYAELNGRANRLAHYLRGLGVKPDARVAICVERSFDMVVGLLAILKAGGAYVPLDPAYPAERLAFMLKDSEPLVLLTSATTKAALSDCLGGIAAIDLKADSRLWDHEEDSNPDRAAIGLRPENLAYVIYTSGSTGTPKGVMIEHRGLCNYLAWAAKIYSPKNGAVVSSSLSFDATVTSLYTPLLCGSEIGLLPDGKEIDALNEQVLGKIACGLVKITPAHLDVLGQRVLQEGARTAVELFVVGGEALPASTVRLWRRNPAGCSHGE